MQVRILPGAPFKLSNKMNFEELYEVRVFLEDLVISGSVPGILIEEAQRHIEYLKSLEMYYEYKEWIYDA